MSNYNHTTVLLYEAVDALNVESDKVYVDCTLGGGGHSREILKRLGPDGKLIVFDHDEDSWNNVPKDSRVILVKENFRHLYRFVKHYKVIPVAGILADLGVSSHHFDIADRGFSYREEGPLDMRMDKREEVTAAQVLNEYTQRELIRIFSEYGEVPNSKTLAKWVVKHREDKPFDTTTNFIEDMSPLIMGDRSRYLARVFQALRIEVNGELESLRMLLDQSAKSLESGGRLVIISFHSLEDRMVKEWTKPQIVSENIMTGEVVMEQEFVLLTKKPILPSAEETKNNKRARSAKMRVAERV